MIRQDARRLVLPPLLLLAFGFIVAFAAGDGPTCPASDPCAAPACASSCEANFLVDMSAGLLNAAFAEPINRQDPICDYVRGTSIRGTSWSTGERWVELGCCSEHAVLDVVARGCSRSQSVGLRSLVELHSESVSSFQVRKRVLLDGAGYHACPAQSSVRAHPTLVDVETRFHGPLDYILRQNAFLQARLHTRRNDRITSQRAEWQANARVDREAEPQLAEANQAFARSLQDVRQRGLSLQALRFASTDSTLKVMALLADSPSAGGWGEPPSITGQPDLVGRLHESGANHAAQATLAGRTLSPEDLAKESGGFLRPLGIRAAPLENPLPLDDKPWSVTLAKEKPLSITFADGGFTLALRVTQFGHGDEKYQGMDITARYRFETSAGVPRAVRQERLEVFPPGYKKTDPPLGIRLEAFRKLVQLRFERLIFMPEFDFGDLTLPGDLRKAGPLTITQATANQGWLLLAWNRKSPSRRNCSTNRSPSGVAPD